MENIIVKFTDSELGNELWNISFDSQKHDFEKCFELAASIMYLPFYEDYNTLKSEYPELTKEYYDIASKILDSGNNGVTDYRFCEFLTSAFGFVCKSINEDVCFNVEHGEYE